MQPTSVARIAGLKARDDLNEQLVLVREQNEDSGRFAVEVLTTGEQVLVKPANLTEADPITGLYRGSLGKADVCHVFVKQLVSKVNANSRSNLEWDEKQSLFDLIVATPCNHAFLALEMNVVGHHCVLDIYRTGKGLSARILQSWVKELCPEGDNGQLVQLGFTANEWLKRPECKWLDEAQLRDFFAQLNDLRRRVSELAGTELRECAKAFGKRNLLSQRAWAASLYARSEKDGVTLQPALPEQAEGYKKEMIAQGLPAHMVIFTGLTSGRPKQVMDFDLDQGMSIVQLGKTLFHEYFGPATFIKALEFHRHELAWKASLLQLA